jgi:enoyl-CoA hydratase
LAAEGTRFAEVVGLGLGMCGLEKFAHPWAFGPRKAKELLLAPTGDAIAADELHAGHGVEVFPLDTIADQAVEFAKRIAAQLGPLAPARSCSAAA